MCIVFLYNTNDDASRYKLVMAANRDEFMNRPTKPADFHAEDANIICGVDMKEGFEGGTWLGITKSGRFSALTNFLGKSIDTSKLPRGRLALEFLKSDLQPLEYLETLQGKDYRDFNLFTGNFTFDGKIQVGFYSSKENQGPRILSDETNVLASTYLNGSWRKVEHGREKFLDILSSKNKLNAEELTDSLFQDLLDDTTCLYPDEKVLEQSEGWLGQEVAEKYCSIKIVDLPVYGTRMQTVVLVDFENNLHFVEKTLTPGSVEPIWVSKTFHFPLKL